VGKLEEAYRLDGRRRISLCTFTVVLLDSDLQLSDQATKSSNNSTMAMADSDYDTLGVE